MDAPSLQETPKLGSPKRPRPAPEEEVSVTGPEDESERKKLLDNIDKCLKLIEDYRALKHSKKHLSGAKPKQVDRAQEKIIWAHKEYCSETSPELVVSLFGNVGSGKSCLINQILRQFSAPDTDHGHESPLPSGRKRGEGLTSAPICVKHSDTEFSLQIVYCSRAEYHERCSMQRSTPKPDAPVHDEERSELLMEIPSVMEPEEALKTFADTISQYQQDHADHLLYTNRFELRYSFAVLKELNITLQDLPGTEDNTYRDLKRRVTAPLLMKSDIVIQFISNERSNISVEMVSNLLIYGAFSSSKVNKRPPKLIFLDNAKRHPIEEKIDMIREARKECNRAEFCDAIAEAFGIRIDAPLQQRPKRKRTSSETETQESSEEVEARATDAIEKFQGKARLVDKLVKEVSYGVFDIVPLPDIDGEPYDFEHEFRGWIRSKRELRKDLYLRKMNEAAITATTHIKWLTRLTESNDLEISKAWVENLNKKLTGPRSRYGAQRESVLSRFRWTWFQEFKREVMEEFDDDTQALSAKRLVKKIWIRHCTRLMDEWLDIQREAAHDMVFGMSDRKKKKPTEIDERRYNLVAELAKDTHSLNHDLVKAKWSEFSQRVTDWIVEKNCISEFLARLKRETSKFMETFMELVSEKTILHQDGYQPIKSNSVNLYNGLIDRAKPLLKGLLVDPDVNSEDSSNLLEELPTPELFTSNRSLVLPTSESDSVLECCTKRYLKSGTEMYVSKGKSLLDKQLRSTVTTEIEDDQQLSDLVIFALNSPDRKVKICCNLTKLKECLKETSDSGPQHVYPLVVTSRPRRGFTPNLWIESLRKYSGKFTLLIMIDGEDYLPYYRRLVKTQAGENYESIRNRIFFMYPERKELGIGRKRKMIMLMMEELKVPHYHLIDDDIDKIYEWCPSRFNWVATDPIRALQFNQNVMRQVLYPPEEQDTRKAALDDLPMVIASNLMSKDRTECKRLSSWITGLIKTIPDDLARDPTVMLREMPPELQDEVRKLFVSKVKLGQVALWKGQSNKRKQQDMVRMRSKQFTHMVSSIRHQVVLYSTEETRGIHPVSDDDLFAEPLAVEDRCLKAKKATSTLKGRDSPVCRELIAAGYKFSDSAHIRQLCMHGVGGYQVFYFYYTNLKAGSVVDGVDPGTLPDDDSQDEEEVMNEMQDKGKEKEEILDEQPTIPQDDSWVRSAFELELSMTQQNQFDS